MRLAFPQTLAVLLVLWSSALAHGEVPEPAVDVTTAQKNLRKAGVGIDPAGLLAFFRKRTVEVGQEERIQQLIQQLGADSFQAREEASRQLMALGVLALPALQRASGSGDLELRRRVQQCLGKVDVGRETDLVMAAASLLGECRTRQAPAVLLNYLPWAPSEEARHAVVLALLRHAHHSRKVAPEVLATLRLPSTEKAQPRKGAAALVVGLVGTPEQQGLVRPLLKASHPSLRLQAARAVLLTQSPEAVPVLIDLLGEGPMELAQDAEDLLIQIAGDHAPGVSLGQEKPAREKCQRAWQAWWNTRGKTVDLARSKLEPLQVNLARRAEVVGQQFIDAIFRTGDAAILKRTAGFPFRIHDSQVFANLEALDAQMAKSRANLRTKKLTWKVEKVMNAEAFTRSMKLPNPGILKGLPLRQVLVLWGPMNLEGTPVTIDVDLYLLVQRKGGQSRVIGITTGETAVKSR
jgi:hypothetical protein